MNVTCNDRDRIFEDGTSTEWAALETHAANCKLCAEELRAWKSLSVAAQEMRYYTETPQLWSRIERSLAQEAAAKTEHAKRNRWFTFLPSISLGWQTALAGASLLILTVSANWIILHRPEHSDVHDQSLLRSKALKDVESAETTYMQAIEKLAAEAKPQLDTPATPLLANYHEKLVVLDSAIADLRAQAGLNPSNAQLRYELLAMYQQKEQTLKEVLEARQ
jgi:hypothetical protein